MPQQAENNDRQPAAPDHRSRVDWSDIGAGILGASPAIAMGLVYVSSAVSIGQSFVNASSAQGAMNKVAQAATVAECEVLLDLCKRRASNPAVHELFELLKKLLETSSGSAAPATGPRT